MSEERAVILIVEDGDEYLDNLSRLLAGFRLVQAHDAAAALAVLQEERVALIFLDMRFDRLDPTRLVGDAGAVQQAQGLERERAQRHLANHQGLYILDLLRGAGFDDLPVILFYDFSRAPRRLANLSRRHSRLRWLPDAATAAEVQELVGELLAPRG